MALSFTLLALTGCKLVDQKTFNPQAGVPQTQVEMTAMPDSTVTKPTVRVYVR